MERNISENIDETIAWHRRAAEAGNAKSMFMLGKLLFEEKNDEEQGMYWLHKAYENGYADAAGYCGTDLSYEHVPGGIAVTGARKHVSNLSIPPVIDGVTVVAIGEYAFRYCNNLRSIRLPSGVTEIGQGAFSGCSGLNSIDLPDSVRKIGVGAFYRCSSLSSIKLPSGMTEIDQGTFAGCSGLCRIELPAGITKIDRKSVV